MTASHHAPDTLQPADTWRDRAACTDQDPDLFFPTAPGPESGRMTGLWLGGLHIRELPAVTP